MKLIGMLDSPYVRRVAISLQLLGLRFDHESLSVFRSFARFQQINPVVKAPSLICDDGVVLMDSTLILAYAEALADRRRSLMPTDIAGLQQTLYVVGLALAACEKSVQIVYERDLRPSEKQHARWIERVSTQLLAACAALETELERHPLAVTSATINQDGISVAVAWQFTQQLLPEIVAKEGYPLLAGFSARAERLPEFIVTPHGSGTYFHED